MPLPDPGICWGENIVLERRPTRLDRSRRRQSSLSTSSCSCRAGHRANILDDHFREVGIGQQHGQFTTGATTYNASMVTQNFALSGSKVFITGVVYNDTVVNDNFFTRRRADRRPQRLAAPGAHRTSTGAGGGYELGFTDGRRQDGELQPRRPVLVQRCRHAHDEQHQDRRRQWPRDLDERHLDGRQRPGHRTARARASRAISLTGIGAANEKLFGNRRGQHAERRLPATIRSLAVSAMTISLRGNDGDGIDTLRSAAPASTR